MPVRNRTGCDPVHTAFRHPMVSRRAARVAPHYFARAFIIASAYW